MSNRTLFHSLSFNDVGAAMAFLTAVGFTEAAVHRDESDPSRVLHAQYDWRETGGVMFGSPRVDDDRGFVDSVGHGQCYCVVASDADVDRVYDAALAAGATSVLAPADPEYGGRGCTVRDPEGNQWSFGSYPGE
jgi:uncharacterized glyoxalase superfamily protein PhnB